MDLKKLIWKHVNTQAIPIRKEKLIFINTGIKCTENRFLKENPNSWQCYKMGKHLHYCSSKFSAHISAVTLIHYTKNIWNLFPLPCALVHHITPPPHNSQTVSFLFSSDVTFLQELNFILPLNMEHIYNCSSSQYNSQYWRVYFSNN